MSTGNCIRTIESNVLGVCFSPDNKYIAGYYESAISLWVVNDDDWSACIHGPRSNIRKVCFSSNGLLASSRIDGSINLWDPAGGQLLRTLNNHECANDMCFSLNGLQLVCSSHKTVNIWNVTAMNWRKAPKEVRQGSSDEKFSVIENSELDQLYNSAIQRCNETYNKMLSLGVAREMARMVLPLSVNTQWIWTLSLQAVAHFVKLRKSPHAQLEIQELANKIEGCVKPLVPISWEALMTCGHC
jgi:WD40 repeat protein